MISITRSQKRINGYTVKTSEPGTGMRGFTAEAPDLAQALAAVQHYYGADHDKCICCFCEKNPRKKR